MVVYEAGGVQLNVCNPNRSVSEPNTLYNHFDHCMLRLRPSQAWSCTRNSGLETNKIAQMSWSSSVKRESSKTLEVIVIARELHACSAADCRERSELQCYIANVRTRTYIWPVVDSDINITGQALSID